MAAAALAVLHRQVARVRRRLILQSLTGYLVWAWSGALLLAVGWFLLQPYLLAAPPAWLRWAVAGGLVGLSTVLAGVLTFLRIPSVPAAALSLDERLRLKERIITALSLTPDQRGSPAGQALLLDAAERVGQADVSSPFPLRLSWAAGLVPAAAAGLVLVALFYEPSFLTPPGIAANRTEPVSAAEKQTIDQKVESLRKRPVSPLAGGLEKSPELERLSEELDRIASQPRDTREQLRDRVKELAPLEEQLLRRERELAEKAQALRQQLEPLNQAAGKSQDGPAKDVQEALSQGDLAKAQKAADDLAKKLGNNELNAEQKDQLGRQLNALKEQLEKPGQLQKAKAEELRQLIQEAKANNRDAEALEKELSKLRQEGKDLQDLQKLAQQMADCQKCLQEGNPGEAAQKMQAAAAQLRELGLTEQQLQQLQQQLQQVQDAREAMARAADRKEDGASGAGTGSGRRPDGTAGPYQTSDERARVEWDPKGRIRIDDYVPGQAFRTPSKAEIESDIRRAVQGAPQALEQQRIPRAARDMARDYFRGLGETEK